MPYGEWFLKEYYERRAKVHKALKDSKIIDAHSHFGNDLFWPNKGTAEEYIENAKEKGIDTCLAMPVPSPVINEDDKQIILSYNEKEGNELIHYMIETSKEGKKKIPNQKGFNPYKKANDMLYKMIQDHKDFHFEYVPLLHPYYYSEEDIVENINRGARVFKIHGIAAGVDPKKIDPEFFKLIDKYNVNLILHTDFSDKDDLLSKNSALNWLEALHPYMIKSYFAHAARLDRKAAEIIRDDNRYVVGLGPDKILSEPGQNPKYVNDYLDYCFSVFGPDKVIFDMDYPWNIKNSKDYSKDWDTIDRINEHLNEEEKQKVYRKNIYEFLV